MQVVPSVILVCTSLADIELMCSSNFYFIIILFSVSSYCALSRKTCDTLSHRIFNLPPLSGKKVGQRVSQIFSMPVCPISSDTQSKTIGTWLV